MSHISIEIVEQPPITVGVVLEDSPGNITVTPPDTSTPAISTTTPSDLSIEIIEGTSLGLDVVSEEGSPSLVEIGIPGPPGPPGEQGPQGIPGISGPAVEVTRIAGENLSALKIVTTNATNKAVLAEPNVSFEKAQAIGITLFAANQDQPVNVRSFGIVQDAFFNFAQGDQLYLGVGGTITDIPPASGFRVVVGKSLGPSEVFIEIGQPLIL